MKTIIAREFYIDYVNNYISVARIAEDYKIEYSAALKLIFDGRIEWDLAVLKEIR